MLKVIIGALTIVIIISFFLPWITVEAASVIGGFSKVLRMEGKTTLSISGFKIPILANSDSSSTIISIIKIFLPDMKRANIKSFLVWLVPVLACMIFWAVRIYGSNRWISMLVALIGLAIFVVAVYKIANTDLDKLIFKASTGWGLWLTLWAYLGMGLAGLVSFIRLGDKKKYASHPV